MTGHRPSKELTKGFPEARKARVAARVSELKAEMALHEPRQARERSQEEGTDHALDEKLSRDGAGKGPRRR
jgi:hypothetical protein